MAGILRLSDKNIKFIEKVNEISGEIVTLCDQCGTCSGSCPLVADMDITPSNMMRLVELGDTEVLETKTFWVCASCFTCTTRCPRGIDIAKVGEALRQIKLREAIDKININDIEEEERKILPPIAIVSAFRKFTS